MPAGQGTGESQFRLAVGDQWNCGANASPVVDAVGENRPGSIYQRPVDLWNVALSARAFFLRIGW